MLKLFQFYVIFNSFLGEGKYFNMNSLKKANKLLVIILIESQILWRMFKQSRQWSNYIK